MQDLCVLRAFLPVVRLLLRGPSPVRPCGRAPCFLPVVRYWVAS
ncbi:hypothetical protein FOTG_06948 [Fusarium oxysporum f. sp. vasinfectum 25433]|uniref:Uncharacterized protein n=1 Tax=Fusarium oxysporum f. sp. vasinfectum 25433 TaxID=1089449 RepID=X0LL51_FUSOX|nr:hypothetical protein FOTG_06948 [Fusarium oxysporum f. sp. vasinfectum 25433]